MSLLGAYTATTNETFRNRVSAGAYQVAAEKMKDEPPADAETIDHDRQLAAAIIRGESYSLDRIIKAVAAHPSIAAKTVEYNGSNSAPDDDILWVIGDLWPAIAKQV